MSQGLRSCSKPAAKADSSRPLNGTDLQKLASMRLNNYQDARSGLHGSLGKTGTEINFAGWVDWQRPLIYLSTTNARPGGTTILVQAAPGVVAYRIGKVTPPSASPGPAADPALPPAEPPSDNWRVRPFGHLIKGEPDPIDGLIGLIFAVAAREPDNSELLGLTESHWLRHDTHLGTPVEVLVGPAVFPIRPWASPSASTAPSGSPSSPRPSMTPTKPSASPGLQGVRRVSPTATPRPSASGTPTASPPAPNSLAAHGGAVAYWLDGSAKLRRMEAMLTHEIAVRVDLQRDERPAINAADVLGGALIKPRKVTKVEAKALAQMRQRNLHARGGRITLTMPVGGGGLILGSGWLDWRNGLAYLYARDADKPEKSVLMHAGGTGISIKSLRQKKTDPPLPAPRGGWETSRWDELGTRVAVTDIDMLLHEALSLAAYGRDDPAAFAKSAHRLRVDMIGKVPVAVFEIPGPADVGLPSGYARLRYWVDATGVVHRIEIRTKTGGLGRLDLDTGRKLPTLPRYV